MMAGPSEILIVADKNNNPDWIAYDMLAQAEHDVSAQSILITDDASLADKVLKSVDDQISVGGENQFIIIGVQMGLLGLINYVGLICYSIRNSYKLYNLEEDFQLKYLPFMVCSLKFALIFPLMTSNAEIYTFLSLFGWFLVGLNERRFDKLKLIT